MAIRLARAELIDQVVGRGAAREWADRFGAAAAEINIAGYMCERRPAFAIPGVKIKCELPTDMFEVGVGGVRQILITGKTDLIAQFTEAQHAFEVFVDVEVGLGDDAELKQAEVLVDRVAHGAVAVYGVVLKAVGQSRFIGGLVKGLANPVHVRPVAHQQLQPTCGGTFLNQPHDLLEAGWIFAKDFQVLRIEQAVPFHRLFEWREAVAFGFRVRGAVGVDFTQQADALHAAQAAADQRAA